jgi:hypothetical protein
MLQGVRIDVWREAIVPGTFHTVGISGKTLRTRGFIISTAGATCGSIRLRTSNIN